MIILQHQVLCVTSVSLSQAQAVRTVFNIAIGSDSADLQRTARSALLQMLNTIVKRVSMDNPV